ncbi:MAG: response regulator transcription factor [Dehalococcoidia bacterium]|nr:response regulator transcription factor [Dehalococcoidia bacterium]
MRIFIVDDNFVARRGLRGVFESEPDIVVAGEAASGREAIEKLIRTPADVVLMDVRMPDVDGIAATAEIARIIPGIRILMATVSEDPAVHMQAMLAGAAGYLVYGHFSVGELLMAVRAVAQGERVGIPPLPQTPDSPDVSSWQLTRRESEILKLIAAGMDNREIAASFAIEEKTVKNHINSIYSKIGVTSRREAIYYMLGREMNG